MSNLGNTENRNATTGPASGVVVTFSVAPGNGSLSSPSAITDSNGNATVGFTMGSQDSVVSAGGGGQSASIGFYRGTEEWTYDHSDSDLAFSGFTANGSTNDLGPGDTRTLTAEVTRNSWDVWVSNYGNTEYLNNSSDPASGISVGFSVSSGDGQLSSGGGTTNASGQATVEFTMLTQSTTVQADAEGQSATITLSPPAAEFHYDHLETTISTTLTADGTTDSLPSGAVRVVTANVSFDSWEVWKDYSGNEDRRNHDSGAANNASMDFYLTEGDGTLSDVASSTDYNGNATATFTMLTQKSTVQATANYAAASSYGTITFTPDPWVWDHAGGPVLSVSLTADDTTSTATAAATITTSDVYSNGSGSYEDRNISTGPAGGATVNFSADGDVTVATASTQTNSAGNATTGYALPVEGGQGNITADASFNDASATDTKPVKQDGMTTTTKVEPQNGVDWELSGDGGNIRLSDLAQYKQADGSYLIPTEISNPWPRNLELGVSYGADAKFDATFVKQSDADGASWWQEQNKNDTGWQPDDGSIRVQNDKTVTLTDVPGQRVRLPDKVIYNPDGSIKVSPPPAQAPVPSDPNLTIKLRFKTHIKVNGVDKGYYEWGVDYDASKNPRSTVVQPVWHAE